MQPTPPKSRKPGYRRPFYDAGKKTSAEIVSEARNTMKILETSRPYTPIESNRRLFGSSGRTPDGRPPSVFSIGPSAFTEPTIKSASRPPTGKLSPLAQVPTRISSDVNPNTLDNLEITRRLSDASIEDTSQKFPHPPKGNDMQQPSNSSNRHSFSERRVQSGPKEHSNERKSDTAKQLRKSNSFGTIDRDIVSADSGVERDIMSAGTFGRVSESLSASNEIFNDYKDSRTSNMSPDNYSFKNSTPESRSSCKNENNLHSSNAVDDCDPNSLSYDTSCDIKASAFKDNVEPLLKQMELNYLHSDIDALSINFDVLWKSLEISGLLVKASSSGSARRRATVLRTIFKFVDVEDPIVILKLCKVALAMKITGKNLVNICKLIFKISKDKTKDSLFKTNKLITDIMEIIKTSDIGTLHEGIIYAIGSIKFLALNSLLHDDLQNANCASCFANLLRDIKALTVDETRTVQLSHLIVQASAAVRNIADIPNIRASFIKNDVLQILMELLQPFWKDPDYMLNVSRILSKLTQYSDCCGIISNGGSDLGILVRAMHFHHKRQDIVVRLAFVLGNVTGKETETRRELYYKHSSLGVFLSILQEYFEYVQRHSSSYNESRKSEVDKSNDVLIKVIRVIANLAIDQSVAVDITNNSEFVDIITSILRYQTKSKAVEELCINIAAMLNNISFHASDDSIFAIKSQELTEALLHLLFIDNMDCIIEATRVYGNFTRFKNIRILLREKKVLHMLVTLLESTEREVVFSACGVLINLMVDSENRPILHAEKGIRKLVDALRDFGQTDWQLASMICQTLWNYSEKITSAVSCFGQEETEDLIQILQDFTDPEIALDYSSNPEVDSETHELMRQIWSEQFENVGVRLLSRINFYHTDLEPLAQDPS